MALVECVPNFSEGRNQETIDAIRDAIAGVSGTHVLDVSSDGSHNRTVVTFVATPDAAVEAAFQAMKVASERIDLNHHEGEHPRIGATDVVPFIPLEGTTMEDCIALARELGARAASELGIPVYLYERAATRPDRENLADVRRGEFEGLREDILVNAARTPDFGERKVHATAGATAVGARPFLVAYNIYLGDKSNLPVAREVAKAIRGSSGGLRYVKGLGMEVDGQAQVSMNLVDTERTPLHRVFEVVKSEAAAHGISPTWSEIVGLVPEKVLLDAGARHVQLRGFSRDMLLEHKVRQAMSGGESVEAFIGRVAAPTPTPGGGSVAAHAGALGAALSQMVAGLTIGKKKYLAVEEQVKDLSLKASSLRRKLASLVERDALAFEELRNANRMPGDDAPSLEAKAAAMRKALHNAAEVPLETARTAVEVAELAATLAEIGNRNAVTDAAVAALLAEAACKGAVWNVRINIAGFAAEEAEHATRLAREATGCVSLTESLARKAEAFAEAAVSQE